MRINFIHGRFILFQNSYPVQLAVQVFYSLPDIETRRREINTLLKMSKRIDVRKMIVITKDEEETILEQEIQIEVIPAWKWLCS